MNDSSSRKPRKPRKKRTPIDPSSKKIYREHQLMEHLLARYTDRERVLNLTRINSVAELADTFYAEAEGIPVCSVTINWLAVKRAIANGLREIRHRAGSKPELTPEQIDQMIDGASASATLYVFEFIPEVVDLALSRLCNEATMARSVHLGRKWVTTGLQVLSRMDYEALRRRLEIDEGPRERFRHRSQYEQALKTAIGEVLADGEKLTQGTVAGKLGKDNEKSIDERVIRRWNTEFGVNWKRFVKEAIKADKS